MGYSVSNGAKVPYSIGSEKVSYSIGNGTIAHEIAYTPQATAVMPTYSISSSAQPYSFEAGGISKYTATGEIKNAPVALGSQKTMTVKALGNLAKKETVAPSPPAEPEVAPEMPVVNETENVSAEPEVAPAPAVVTLGIKGMVKDENETALAGWKIDLATSSNKAIANTTSSEDGSYSFGNLTAGDYMVSEVLLAGWVAVSPADGVASITLSDMEVTQDFINKKTA